MKTKTTKTENIETQVKRDLPDSYYVPQENPMTRKEVDALLTKHYDYLCKKIRDNYKTQLEITAAKDDVYDALNTVLVNMYRRFDAGKISFQCAGDFVGYILRSGWRELAGTNKIKTKEVEGKQEGDFSKIQLRVQHIGGGVGWEFPSVPRASRGSMDLRDDLSSNIWNRLWESMAEAVMRGQLSFRDVAIYKHYMLHKYIILQNDDVNNKPSYTIKKMAAEGDFSIKQITKALRVVKAYISDYLMTMKLPEDIGYEDEAEDIFGY